MTCFTVEPLPREHIRAVYPLVREAIPGLGLTEWLRFARGTATRRDPKPEARGEASPGDESGGSAPRGREAQTGIIVARRKGHAYPGGLVCYRVARDPMLNRVLVAEHFVAVDLLHPAAVFAALTRELEALGRRLGCTAVRGLAGRPDVEGGLASAGYDTVGSLLGKTITDGDGGSSSGEGRA